ncbi:conserved hypothetical protein [Shewanella halifaxensis HAW-EB4]|uniref:Uncharacterized protein n=1 Tax=Shewanella halifaxensis (strain HAW-EB4) TaxID=458817 RepID=B0TU93_SHEHH|nr:hypothetical protein [Shewanella halifaxensis]ABZ78204.1 conserved hypothetical protein [Shewanella halifaxensis HAW-EB4]
MFNSTVLKTVKASVFTALLLGTSATVHAETSLVSDVANNIEQNISAQMQDMMTKAQTELSLSIQAQMSEMLFDMASEEQVTNEQLAAENKDQPLVTSAVTKD